MMSKGSSGGRRRGTVGDGNNEEGARSRSVARAGSRAPFTLHSRADLRCGQRCSGSTNCRRAEHMPIGKQIPKNEGRRKHARTHMAGKAGD
eukprot:4615703-Pyramimonas_sp.AAC.1